MTRPEAIKVLTEFAKLNIGDIDNKEYYDEIKLAINTIEAVK